MTKQYKNQQFDTALWFEPYDKFGDLKAENRPYLSGLITDASGNAQKVVAWAPFEYCEESGRWYIEMPQKNAKGKYPPLIKVKRDNSYQIARERIEEQGRNVIDNPTTQSRGDHGKLDEVHGNEANIKFAIDDRDDSDKVDF